MSEPPSERRILQGVPTMYVVFLIFWHISEWANIIHLHGSKESVWNKDIIDWHNLEENIKSLYFKEKNWILQNSKIDNMVFCSKWASWLLFNQGLLQAINNCLCISLWCAFFPQFFACPFKSDLQRFFFLLFCCVKHFLEDPKGSSTEHRKMSKNQKRLWCLWYYFYYLLLKLLT